MSLLKENYHRIIFFYSLLLIAITLPFSIKLNSFFIILLCANWVFEGNFKNKLSRFLSQRTVLIFAAFYLLHVAGMSYTEIQSAGRFELEKKLSLLVLPLVLSTTPPLERIRLMQILKAFVFSCTALSLLCLSVAIYKNNADGDTSHFFYHQLAQNVGIHAVYFSFYLSFCLFILIGWFSRAGKNLRIVQVVWMLFLLLMMFLLASKMILISAFLLLNAFFLLRSRGNKWRRAGMLFLLNLVLAGFLWMLPASRERFRQELNTNLAVLQQDDFSYNTPFTGTSLRMVIWKSALEILDENNAWLTGVGTGDVQHLLNKKYVQHKMYTGIPGTSDHGYLFYNAHNQYMETLLGLGIIGLILLIACFFFTILQAWRQRNLLLVGMLLMFFLFSFTETTLATHKGVVFFAFFTSLLLYHYGKIDTEK